MRDCGYGCGSQVESHRGPIRYEAVSPDQVAIQDLEYTTSVDPEGDIFVSYNIYTTGPGVFDVDHCTRSLWTNLSGTRLILDVEFDGEIIERREVCWPQNTEDRYAEFQFTAPPTTGEYVLDVIIRRQSDNEIVADRGLFVQVGDTSGCSAGDCPSGYTCDTTTGECVPDDGSNGGNGGDGDGDGGIGLPDFNPCFLDPDRNCVGMELAGWVLILVIIVYLGADLVIDAHPVLG